MAKQGSPKMDNPFTTFLELPHSVNTLFFMLAVLPRSTLLPHLTKFVLSVADFAQVCHISTNFDFRFFIELFNTIFCFGEPHKTTL